MTCAQTAAALEELAKATDSNMQEAGEITVDAAAFTVAMRDANIDKEFSGRLFEFLDEGAHSWLCLSASLGRLQSCPVRPGGQSVPPDSLWHKRHCVGAVPRLGFDLQALSARAMQGDRDCVCSYLDRTHAICRQTVTVNSQPARTGLKIAW